MSAGGRRLILFLRFPRSGMVKTRLIPALGADGAAALHRRMVLRALRAAAAACRNVGASLEIRFDGGTEDALQHWLGDHWRCRPQGEGDLGARMARAFRDADQEGSLATLLIGSDCPELTAELLAAAFHQINGSPVIFGPANDGGYYLVGLARPIPELFDGIGWGSGTVLAESLHVLQRHGLKPALLTPLDDIDRAEDLPHWQRIVEKEESDLSRISVIIPVLNEAPRITSAIRTARQGAPHEIIVVDGGSTDGSQPLAHAAGATVIQSRPGRARQMNAGAAIAAGHALLFLHADTALPVGYRDNVLASLRRPTVVGGAFRFGLADRFPGCWLVEGMTNLRAHLGRMPYGDQALFVRRRIFEELGGFSDLPIMEDYEFVRRLRRTGRLAVLDAVALTSGRRWQRLGVLRTTMIHQLVILGYHCGVPPAKLAALYHRYTRPRITREIRAQNAMSISQS